jgi:hypothetical protein
MLRSVVKDLFQERHRLNSIRSLENSFQSFLAGNIIRRQRLPVFGVHKLADVFLLKPHGHCRDVVRAACSLEKLCDPRANLTRSKDWRIFLVVMSLWTFEL